MKRNLIFLLLFAVSAVAVSAQVRPPLPRPSSKAAVMQTIATTDVSIAYSRPAVKGRKVFGDWPTKVEGEATLDDGRARPEGAPLVPNDHIWRAGANEATLFTVDSDVLINGQELKAGKYSLHMIPTKGDWTIIFNSDDGQWGSFSYNKAKDVLRVTTKAEWVADSKEFLMFGFENVGEKSATAYLRWEKVKVPFTVEVKDVVGATMTKLKAYIAGDTTDAQRLVNAAGYAKANKLADQATAWFNEALKVNDASVAKKETFGNLQRKATILLNLNRGPEALTAAERAVVVGKADSTVTKAQIDALEKRIADIKAGKQ
ncbi:MAG TPA: DUF2911 domain-containing protein [Pyrinomonadaceae bacterium]|nr:DUF2911 domain-containing protein [Pyrinomonadaceae bacterium]